MYMCSYAKYMYVSFYANETGSFSAFLAFCSAPATREATSWTYTDILGT